MFISLFISLFCILLFIFMFSASILVNKAVYKAVNCSHSVALIALSDYIHAPAADRAHQLGPLRT